MVLAFQGRSSAGCLIAVSDAQPYTPHTPDHGFDKCAYRMHICGLWRRVPQLHALRAAAPSCMVPQHGNLFIPKSVLTCTDTGDGTHACPRATRERTLQALILACPDKPAPLLMCHSCARA